MNQIQIGKIKNLVTVLNEYRDAYYNRQQPLVSDVEYDKLYDKLLELERVTGFVMANSPTQTVGYEVKSKLQKVKHNHPMLSLDKTKSVEELVSFFDNKESLLMLKLDGLTISVRYLNGKLVSAETRGNGEIGEDILHNAKVFENLPLHIECKDEVIIDGEAIITYQDFLKINKILIQKAKEEATTKGLSGEEFEQYVKEHSYKNPRNLASGSVRQLDNKIAADRHIKFIAWKMVKGSNSNSFTDRLYQLSGMGFEVVPYLYIGKNSKIALEKYISRLQKIAEEESYPIDGMVGSFDDIAYGDSLGMTGHHLRSQFAFKFEDEEVETVLKDIDWTMGKTGVLTPTAIFEPVEIDGTTVERASLHNLSIMDKLYPLSKWHSGLTLSVYKANQIIPQISKVEHKFDSCAKRLSPPTFCPLCHEKTEIKQENDTKILVCTNPHCKGKRLGQFSHFVSKNAMNIDGLSEAKLEKLIEEDFINDFIDIYELENNFPNDIAKLEGFGKKSVKKLFNAIHQSTNTTLDRFIYALCIPLIGRSASKTISKCFKGNFVQFYHALENEQYDWTQLEDFGDTMAESIRSYADEQNMEMIWELSQYMQFEEMNGQGDNSLDGKTFVITGKLNTFDNRDAAKEQIELHGGKVAGTVSKNTDYLVNNDILSTSGKNKKAKQLNIPIITEEELLIMLK